MLNITEIKALTALKRRLVRRGRANPDAREVVFFMRVASGTPDLRMTLARTPDAERLHTEGWYAIPRAEWMRLYNQQPGD